MSIYFIRMKNSKPSILHLDQIKSCLKKVDLIPLIEEGFVAYSEGRSVVPPVGELIFEDPPGDTHIKYGYIRNQEYYTVKIASGFYNNPAIGLKASQGIMLIFSQSTGLLECILLDGGFLTDIRTVIASMITIKYLAPDEVKRVGVMGTGIQAALQLEYLCKYFKYKDIMIWGRDKEKAVDLKNKMHDLPCQIHVCKDSTELANRCDVIITTTASDSPILNYKDLRPNVHITALGSDTGHKVELDSSILERSDIVVSDSISQSHSRGEVFRARQAGCINDTEMIELGQLIANPSLGRKGGDEITVADLTGVAVQDIMIATAIYNHYLNGSE